MEFTIKDLIKDADEWIEDFTNEDGSIDEKRKAEVVASIEGDIMDGSMGNVEGVIILAAMDGLDKETLPADLISINVTVYPQFKTVERALMRRMNDVPMQCVLVDWVIDDFLRSYCNRSINFDELIYRLVMLGRIPYSDYLRMSPKERRELGTDVAMFHLW